MTKENNSMEAPPGIAYTVSQKEIHRRKLAFTTLITSLLIALTVPFLDLALSNIVPAAMIITSLGIFLFILRLLVNRSLDNFSQMLILLDAHSIVRKTTKSEEAYPLKNIDKLSIKRTSQGNIREVGISFSSGKSLFVNGLENFEQFAAQLQDNLREDSLMRESQEKIDFDHPLFYPIFGAVFGVASATLLRFSLKLSSAGFRFLRFSFLLYSIGVGLIIIIKKPVSTRFGNKAKTYDYILGILILILSAILCYL